MLDPECTLSRVAHSLTIGATEATLTVSVCTATIECKINTNLNK